MTIVVPLWAQKLRVQSGRCACVCLCWQAFVACVCVGVCVWMYVHMLVCHQWDRKRAGDCRSVWVYDEGALSPGPRISVPDTQVIKVCPGAPWLLERWCLMLSEWNMATPARRRSTEAFLYDCSWCRAPSCDSGRGQRISACCRSTITPGGREWRGRQPPHRPRHWNIYSRVLLAWQQLHCAETGSFLFQPYQLWLIIDHWTGDSSLTGSDGFFPIHIPAKLKQPISSRSQWGLYSEGKGFL